MQQLTFGDISSPNGEMDKFVPGTLVLRKYLLPRGSLQPWLVLFHTGTIEELGKDPVWNGEENYCRKLRKARVRFPFGVEYEAIDDLLIITPEQASLPLREKIALFLGDDALANYDRASRTERR